MNNQNVAGLFYLLLILFIFICPFLFLQLKYRFSRKSESLQAEETLFTIEFCKFYLTQEVMHVKSKIRYRIVALPTHNRLEALNEPCYGYKAITGVGPTWYRGQSEMEDGRFINVPKTFHSHSSGVSCD